MTSKTVRRPSAVLKGKPGEHLDAEMPPSLPSEVPIGVRDRAPEEGKVA